jgi:hypothetical protein
MLASCAPEPVFRTTVLVEQVHADSAIDTVSIALVTEDSASVTYELLDGAWLLQDYHGAEEEGTYRFPTSVSYFNVLEIKSCRLRNKCQTPSL